MSQAKWYNCWLDYSNAFLGEAYRFQCKTCGYTTDRPSGEGFDPPAACYNCAKEEASKCPKS